MRTEIQIDRIWCLYTFSCINMRYSSWVLRFFNLYLPLRPTQTKKWTTYLRITPFLQTTTTADRSDKFHLTGSPFTSCVAPAASTSTIILASWSDPRHGYPSTRHSECISYFSKYNLYLLSLEQSVCYSFDELAGHGMEVVNKSDCQWAATKLATILGLRVSMITIDNLTPSNVPLGAGPPTKEELLVHYPAKFTWHELKTFINAGYATSLHRST